MPRKREIQDMREQMKEMELELLQYHKSNAALDLMIGELKLKRDGMQREVDRLQADIDGKDEELKKIARDVAAVASVAGDVKALRAAITRLYHKYIHGDSGNLAGAIAKMGSTSGGGGGGGGAGGEGGEDKPTAPAGVDIVDVQRELARQRLYLERNIDSIRKKMDKDDTSARMDHARLMRENMVLTREINDLRRDMRYTQGELARTAGGGGSATDAGGGGGGGGGGVPLASASSSLFTGAGEGGLDVSLMDVAAAAADLGIPLDDMGGGSEGGSAALAGTEEAKHPSPLMRASSAGARMLVGGGGGGGGDALDTHLLSSAAGAGGVAASVAATSARPAAGGAGRPPAAPATSGMPISAGTMRRTGAMYGVVGNPEVGGATARYATTGAAALAAAVAALSGGGGRPPSTAATAGTSFSGASSARPLASAAAASLRR